MEVPQLEAFVTVVDIGSFTRAAARLGLSQPTVTSRIKTLEHELGATLVERLPAGIRPTASGSALLGYARDIIALHARAKLSVDAGGQPHGHIDVGTIGTLTNHRLLPVVEYMYFRFPKVQLSMRAIQQGAVEEVRCGRLDCAFFVDTLQTRDDVGIRVLCREPLLLVSGPDHPLQRLSLVTTEDVKQATLVRSDYGADYHLRFESSLGWSDASLRPRLFELDSLDAAKRSVANGIGIALLPEVAVADELATGVLRRIAWEPPFETYTQLAWRPVNSRNAALSAVMDAATEVLGEQFDDCLDACG